MNKDLKFDFIIVTKCDWNYLQFAAQHKKEKQTQMKLISSLQGRQTSH